MSEITSTLFLLCLPLSLLVHRRCLGLANLSATKCINRRTQCLVLGRYNMWSRWAQLEYGFRNLPSTSYSLQ